MKSLRYTAIAYLLIGSLSMQAMNDNNQSMSKNRKSDECVSPFNQLSNYMPSKYTELKTAEQELTNEALELYTKDMSAIENSLTNTYKNPVILWAQPCCHPCNYTFPAMRGQLSKIVLLRSVFYEGHRLSECTPNDIRSGIIIRYTQCGKNVTTQIDNSQRINLPDEQINNDLALLKQLPLECSKDKITTLVREKLANILQNSVRKDSQEKDINILSTYVLGAACKAYCRGKKGAMIALQDDFNTYWNAYLDTEHA